MPATRGDLSGDKIGVLQGWDNIGVLQGILEGLERDWGRMPPKTDPQAQQLRPTSVTVGAVVSACAKAPLREISGSRVYGLGFRVG